MKQKIIKKLIKELLQELKTNSILYETLEKHSRAPFQMQNDFSILWLKPQKKELKK